MQATMSQVAGWQRHVVFDGAVDVIARSKELGHISHCLHVGPELGDSLGCFAKSQSEICKVVDVGFQELTAERQDAIIAS